MFCVLTKVNSKLLRMKPIVVNQTANEYYPLIINNKYSLLTSYSQVYKHNKLLLSLDSAHFKRE